MATSVQGVIGSYKTGLRFIWPLLLVHLSIRLLVGAIIVPVASLIVSAAIAARGQNALTDQDIAYFVLTPLGFVVVLIVASLFIVSAILDVAVISTVLRNPPQKTRNVFGHVLDFLTTRSVALFGFSTRLVLRVLGLAVPFVAAASAIVLLALGDYDINYYLTYWPPTFVIALSATVLVGIAFAAILVRFLSGWAIALHLLLYERLPAARTFATSSQVLSGRRADLIVRVLSWFVARALLAGAVAGLAGFLINIVPGLFGAKLEMMAAAISVVLLLWATGNAFVSALSNGALADLLGQVYEQANTSTSMATGTAHRSDLIPMRLPAVVLLVGAVVAIGGGVYLGGSIIDAAMAERRVEIIAHRGASGVRPENTMAAVRTALDDQADWVEIDVQETADGEVIVAHDSDFMKVAGLDLKIWNATKKDLTEIDVGSWFDPTYSKERTPTLREVLLTAKGRGKVIIELKYYGHDVDLEARVARIVTETGMAGSSAVMSLKYAGVEKMRDLRPDWRFGVLAARAIGNLASLQADFLAVNTGQINAWLIQQTHAKGKQIYAWTVDDPLTMSRMISMGVDGLITNEPALARKVMQARNELSTFERLALWMADRFSIGSFDLIGNESDA